MNLVHDIGFAQKEEYFKETLKYSLSSDSCKESDDLIRNLLSLIPLSETSHVLVAPCLEGNYCLTLNKRGVKVTGCAEHISSFNSCKGREEAVNMQVEWILSRLEDYSKANTYNLILCLDYMFGACEEEVTNKKILSNFYDSLVPGGKVVFQLIDRNMLEKYFHPKYWVKLDKNCFLLNERQLGLDGWLQESYYLLKDGDVKNFNYGQRVYYPGHFAAMLEECGFRHVGFFGDLLGNPYTDQASSLFIIAEKISEKYLIRC